MSDEDTTTEPEGSEEVTDTKPQDPEAAANQENSSAVKEEEKEFKIVITHKNGSALIGVNRTGCDPLFFKQDGELGEVMHAIPKFVEESIIKWETDPLNPKADPPAPPPPQPVPHVATAIPTTARKKAAESGTVKMF